MKKNKKHFVEEILTGIPDLNCANCSQVLNTGNGASRLVNLEMLQGIFPNAVITTGVQGGVTQKNTNAYDVIIADVLLGEAAMNGKATETFEKLMDMDFKYLVLIDYLEDPDIDWTYIDACIISDPRYIRCYVDTLDITTPTAFKKFKAETLNIYVIKKR